LAATVAMGINEPMSRKSVPEAEHFDKQEDAGSFDHAASYYGKHIEKLSAPLAVRIVEWADITQGQRVLDVGTGTGIAARCAARAVGGQGKAFGIDLSDGMLDAARYESDRQGLENIRFLKMDSEELGFPDHHFDAVISLCAVAHFPHLDVALREIRRSLRPGRKAVVAIGAGRPPWGSGLARYAIGRLVKMIQSAFQPQLWAPGAIMDFVDSREPELPTAIFAEWQKRDPYRRLCLAIQEAGFEIDGTGWTGHTPCFDSALDFWEAQISIVTAARQRLLHLGAKRLAVLRDEFVASAQRVLDRNGRLYYPFGAYFVRGRVPDRTLKFRSDGELSERPVRRQ